MGRKIVIGSRKSALALAQSNSVRQELLKLTPDTPVSIKELVTKGDVILDRTLPEIGGKGLFTAELEAALRNGEIDLAVHSFKDLPTDLERDLTIAATPQREVPFDVLVSKDALKFEQLPSGSIVGTSSLRRQAQLLHLRPDLKIISIRGNIDTRVRKALEQQAGMVGIVLAEAGLRRLSPNNPQPLAQYSRLGFEISLPAPAQGALAIQCRSSDKELLEILSALNHLPTQTAVAAERAFLARLNAGCSTPVAAFAEWRGRELSLQTRCLSPDGQKVIEINQSKKIDMLDLIAIANFSIELAEQALAKGAAELLSR